MGDASRPPSGVKRGSKYMFQRAQVLVFCKDYCFSISVSRDMYLDFGEGYREGSGGVLLFYLDCG